MNWREFLQLRDKYNRAVRMRDPGLKGQLLGELAEALEMDDVSDFSHSTFRRIEKRLEEEVRKIEVARNVAYVQENGFEVGTQVLHGRDNDLMEITKINTQTGRVSVKYVKSAKKGFNTTAISLRLAPAELAGQE